MRRLLKPLWVFLAIVFLIEAWLWDKLSPIVAFIVGLIPLATVKAKIAAFVERLPPALSLVVFIIPVILILPFKLVGLWLIAREHIVLGAATFLMAKFVGLGVTAFLFDVTRDKLLSMAWFARFYRWVIAVRDWAHAQTAPIKARIHAIAEYMRERIGGTGLFGRKLAFLRRKAQKAAAP
jgi:hypothetical protein